MIIIITITPGCKVFFLHINSRFIIIAQHITDVDNRYRSWNANKFWFNLLTNVCPHLTSKNIRVLFHTLA